MGQGQEKKSPGWVSKDCEEPQGTDTFTYAHIYFQLDDEDNKNVGNADKYIFDVRRYKDIATKEEYLNIRVYEVAVDDICAEIERTNIIELERNLLNLRIYGVLLDRKHFPKVRQLIEKIYPGLSPRPVDNSTLLTSKVVNDIYEMFVRYIREVPIEAKSGLYNIPVDEFKEYLADTKFSKYKYSDIRDGLAKFTRKIDQENVKGTKCSYGRKDNTIAKGDKRIKVISFVQAVVDDY